MKRLLKQGDDQAGRPRYDEVKTPLQRLLLSGVVSVEKRQELTEVMQALDPVRLIEQVKHLQRAVLRHAVTFSAMVQRTPPAVVEVFLVEDWLEQSQLVLVLESEAPAQTFLRTFSSPLARNAAKKAKASIESVT